jgi:microsomal dipeptidase-like Zn-dependent dipeptidase
MGQLGWDAVILSSDFGQAGNPLHPDGMLAVFAGLRKEGLTVDQIDRIAKTNPARLLGVK